MTSEKKQIFSNLKQLADLMSRMFGDNCEVAIHDLTTEKMQLVYITGNVTRREIGAPVTDVVTKYFINGGRLNPEGRPMAYLILQLHTSFPVTENLIEMVFCRYHAGFVVLTDL
jgi:hypothetical protein